MNRIYSFLFLFLSLYAFSQTLPRSRSVDWTLAGLRDTTSIGFVEIDMQAQGAIGNGTTPNDSMIASVLSNIAEPGVILNFPAGNFLFNKTINVPSNVIIRGEGPANTIFTMDLGHQGHGFSIKGYPNTSDFTIITESAFKDSSFIMVHNSSVFSAGDWLRIIQNDVDLVTSSWGEETVGQIVQIEAISNNKIILKSPLRMGYSTSRAPYIIKVVPAENVGIECIKIHRIDNTAPEQSSNIYFFYAVNCWVMGLESENCTFSHIQSRYSSNLCFTKSYFHDGFDYGDGGRAYGIMIQFTSNECLIENNIFKQLRHSMIMQAGANGNVFAFNYSLDPYWDTQPHNSSGDMVLHGNYVYANLFEQNICQNIVIDNSHGPNGPYNTFFRNRSEGYGIFFSADNSPSQNFLGNEITNTHLPYSLVNYLIQGSDHFLFGNNNKGTIDPVGTNSLMDSSYAYKHRPDFVPMSQWVRIGTPNVMGTASIPAYDRYHSGVIFGNECGTSSGIKNNFSIEEKILIFPNPVQNYMTIESSHGIQNLTIINSLGQQVYYQENIGLSTRVKTSEWSNGVYFVLIHFSDNKYTSKIVLKTTDVE